MITHILNKNASETCKWRREGYFCDVSLTCFAVVLIFLLGCTAEKPEPVAVAPAPAPLVKPSAQDSVGFSVLATSDSTIEFRRNGKEFMTMFVDAEGIYALEYDVAISLDVLTNQFLLALEQMAGELEE